MLRVSPRPSFPTAASAQRSRHVVCAAVDSDSDVDLNALELRSVLESAFNFVAENVKPMFVTILLPDSGALRVESVEEVKGIAVMSIL